ncbi:MAG: hypothetical protein ACRCYS_19050 [Beijerinckiaceae bacterium]
MPITVEQKKEYHRQGFRVIDARFAPADAVIEEPAEEKPARKARRSKAAEQSEE